MPYSFLSLCPPTSCRHHSHLYLREAGTVLDSSMHSALEREIGKPGPVDFIRER